MEKILGKISNVEYGKDDRGCLGLHFTFTMTSSGVSDSRAVATFEHSQYSNWTEEERNESIIELFWYLNNLLDEAKVSSVDKLKNIPVELTFDRNLLKDFRILTEVL